jgi:flavin-dependent dehydrogenase
VGDVTGRRFDAVIIGARCAGATLAACLARAGARVMMVDRSPLPSDQILSTHNIHPPGMDILDDLGVGDAVRAEAPATRVLRIRKNDAWMDVPFDEGRAGYCPRRLRLDGLLQDAAVGAGAELRDRARATGVRFEQGRAVGVKVEHRGASEDITADLVVGADGRHSFVARAVAADEYLAYDAPRGICWAYWDAPPAWRDCPFGMYVAHIGDAIRFVFQTDHNQLVVGSLPGLPLDEAWRADMTVALRNDLPRDPVIGPLLDGHAPDSRIRATFRERYFFRRAAGPGWVLVGDAGHHKDFVIGDGITEALIQAKSLAQAIVEGGDASLLRWWRARDVAALPAYHWGRDEGAAGSPGELETRVIARLARHPKWRSRIARLPEHRSSPYTVVPVPAVVTALAAALVRGRLVVVPDLIMQLSRMLRYRKCIGQRMRLLRDISPR